ncbi:hypothetical protein BCR42DRAFT_424227 [Absidia repens]|uniref:Uncharacterized protein n=1 Tax=Absidia repens TaxID=90262 RepID=A0A1X2I3W8_9FUNG|nr:hypothetical protein BCR42DRAFT_424227 [Absidia repens]
MAFAQQQRRPRHRSQHSETTSEDLPIISPVQSSSNINHVLSPGPIHSTTTVTNVAPTISATYSTSDSETDWHVISSGLRSSSLTTTSSLSSSGTPASRPSTSHLGSLRRDSVDQPLSSDLESFSSFRPSDTESFSDIDFAFEVLPSHDGTGAFMDDDMDPTSEEETLTIQQQQQLAVEIELDPSASSSPTPQNALIQRNKKTSTMSRVSTSFGDFEPSSPSMPNILLPYGGIHLPSFAAAAVATTSNSNNSDNVNTPYASALDHPTFQPTVISKDLVGTSSDEYTSDTLSRQQHQHQQLEDSSSTTSTNSSADQIKFTRKRRRNLDSIPTHHPSLPGTITSFAILSALWNNLRRLTNHLIENDTYTADAFTSLVSEATLEGCLPFGSHLHMELAAGLRPAYSNRRYEGLPGM